jgi:hypothetical protein
MAGRANGAFRPATPMPPGTKRALVTFQTGSLGNSIGSGSTRPGWSYTQTACQVTRLGPPLFDEASRAWFRRCRTRHPRARPFRGRRYGAGERAVIRDLVDQVVARGATLARCCARLGLSARTVERWRTKPDDMRHGPKSEPHNTTHGTPPELGLRARLPGWRQVSVRGRTLRPHATCLLRSRTGRETDPTCRMTLERLDCRAAARSRSIGPVVLLRR